MNKKLLFDVILIASLILCALIALFIVEATKEPGATVTVSVDGEQIASYSLSENGEFPISGGKNILIIEGGEAYMKSADCPDQTCVRTGRISRTGERIVCLPNRVSISIIGSGEEIFESK